MWEESGFGGSSNGSQYIGPNPSKSAKIVYYLKKRHTFGAMTMEVFDQSGKKIASVDPGKQKGINIVTWDYIFKAPKVAKGKTFAFGGFSAPRVPAGTYKIVMKKGKDTFESTLDLVYDPKSTITAESRKLQQETIAKLYNMTQDLAYMVYDLDSHLDYSGKLVAKDAKLTKVTAPFVTDLNKLKETLVVTTGDNYVGAAEPQLREKISDLYSVMVSNFDKPSNTQMESLTGLETRFAEAKASYDKIKAKHVNNILKAAELNKISTMQVTSFDMFVEQ